MDWTLVAAVAASVTALFLGIQLLRERQVNNDRRLDDRINGIIGKRIVEIADLAEEARKTLATAHSVTGDVQRVRAEIDQILEKTKQAGEEHQTIVQEGIAELSEAHEEASRAAEEVTSLLAQARRESITARAAVDALIEAADRNMRRVEVELRSAEMNLQRLKQERGDRVRASRKQAEDPSHTTSKHSNIRSLAAEQAQREYVDLLREERDALAQRMSELESSKQYIRM